MYMYLNRVIIVLLLVHNFKVKCDAVHMYIEEVYKKNGSWDFLVRQIFVFVDLFLMEDLTVGCIFLVLYRVIVFREQRFSASSVLQ